jgi:hypothetical protein
MRQSGNLMGTKEVNRWPTRGDASGGQLFDEMTRALAVEMPSRRRALKLLAGGALAALAAGWGIGVKESDAVEVARDNQTCADKPAISNRRCPRVVQCGGEEFCTCARTVDGDKKCIGLRSAHCPNVDECDSDRDCGSGRVCVQVGACCGHERRNACFRRCP